MIRRILVPLDGSELAEAALSFVGPLYRAFSPSVLLFRVSERGGDARNGLGCVEWRLERAEVEAYLESEARKLRKAGMEKVKWRLETGDAAEEIVAVAREWHADLIVLSTHGEGGITAFPVSGTAQKVVLSAPSSVLLARPAADPTGGRDGPDRDVLERIVVAVDGSSRGDWALCLAGSLARAAGAEVVLLSVLPTPDVFPGSERHSDALENAVQAIESLNRSAAEGHLRRLARELEASGLEVRTRIVTSDATVARTVDRVCAEEAAPLLVLAAHGASPANGWPFGTVTNHLLFHGAVPLLVFQDNPRAPRERRPFSIGRGMIGDRRGAWTP